MAIVFFTETLAMIKDPHQVDDHPNVNPSGSNRAIDHGTAVFFDFPSFDSTAGLLLAF